MIFHDVTVTLAGKQVSRRVHETSRLVAGAVEVFRDMLERHGSHFREPIPVPQFAEVQLAWTADPAYPGCAAATFYRGAGNAILTTSMLVAGIDPAADRVALQHQQSMLFQILRSRGAEPAIDLLAIADRPLIVSTPFPQETWEGVQAVSVVADMETCLAAAFFLSGEGQ